MERVRLAGLQGSLVSSWMGIEPRTGDPGGGEKDRYPSEGCQVYFLH